MSMEYTDKQARWATVIENVIGNYLATGVIHNADWQEAKRCCNNLIESITRQIWEAYLNKGHRGNQRIPESYYSNPYMNQLVGYLKKVGNDLKLAAAQMSASVLDRTGLDVMYGDQLEALAALQTEVLRIHEAYASQLIAMKDKIVKGRKLGERKTPERTLDHTGTCAICGKNVKMDKDGLLVDHGFTIDFGQRAGHCFGCGYEPIELSPKALKDYLEKVLEPWKAQRRAYKEGLHEAHDIVSSFRYDAHRKPRVFNEEDPLFATVKQEEFRRVEREINAVTARIIGVKTQITTWAPKALPGAK
jgi:hypothetical protein